MKKHIFWTFFLFSLFLNQLDAQTTIVLQPNAIQGKDAIVLSNNGNNNYANSESNTAYTWTIGGNLAIKRIFLEFDFSSIPANSIISSASLSLYYNPIDSYESFDFHTGTNNIYIEKVSSSWDENTITWNNQPSTSLVNQVSLPPSSSQTQDYVNIDVTNMVIEMNNPSIGNNGFMIRMVDEINYYKSVLFASSDHIVDSLHPKIEITYIEKLIDCSGIPNGNAYIDECGVCDEDPNNDNETCFLGIIIPTAFSPNGDGINDQLKIFTKNNNTEVLSFQIYNRWGKLIVEKTNFIIAESTDIWDGVVENKDAPIGVYVYYCLFENAENKSELVKGNITLLR